MVIWIIGLSGSGKSFYAKKLAKFFKKNKNKKVFVIDGDEVRKFITYKLKYSISDRKQNSLVISDLCRYLEFKGYIVICPILSIFRSHQKRNRKLFKKYLQIYIDVPIAELRKRNNKKIYSKKNVVGKDINFPDPYKSDLILKNTFSNDYKKNLKKILKLINA